MMNARKVSVFTATVFTAAALSLAGWSTAQAASSDQLPPGITWSASVPGNTASLYARTDGTTFVAASPTAADPRLLNPVQWFECETLNDPGYLIKEYAVQPGGGYTASSVKLLCGTANAGYLHITNHAAEWQSRVDYAGGGVHWDDLMDYGAEQALAHPTTVLDQGNLKTCYQTPVTVIRSNGSNFVFFTSVIVSQNNGWVISAFPPSSPHC